MEAKTIGVVCASALCFGVAACDSWDNGATSDEAIEGQSQALYGSPGTHYWNMAGGVYTETRGDPGVVPICWCQNAWNGRDDTGQSIYVNPDGTPVTPPPPALQTIRDWTRMAIENAWSRAANITFTGWGRCASDDAANTMVMHFGPSDVSGVGRNPSGPTVVTFNGHRTTQDSFQHYCTHEVGHALGFDHEWTRPDNYLPGGAHVCPDTDPNSTPNVGGEYLTDFVDLGSMMYCGNVVRPDLGPGDVMGAQRRYGRKPGGSVVGWGGRCAIIPGANQNPGTQLVVGNCGGTWDQTWHYASLGAGSGSTSPLCASVPSTLASYALYASGNIRLANYAQVLGGKVGSATGDLSFDTDVILNGDVLTSRNLSLSHRATIRGNATTGGTITNLPSDATIIGIPTQNASVPAQTIPTRSFTCSDNGYLTVDAAHPRTLSAGQHGNVSVRAGGTLTLQSGAHTFASLRFESGGPGNFAKLRLDLSGGTLDVQACGELSFGASMQTTFVDGNASGERVSYYTKSSNMVYIGNAPFFGIVTAPQAEIHAYSNAVLKSRLYGKTITLEPNTQLDGNGICGTGLDVLTTNTGSANLCWNVAGQVTPKTITPIATATCSLTDSERFSAIDVTWQAMGNMCVVVDSATAGAQLRVDACGVNALQRWDFFQPTPGQIRLTGTNLCVAAPVASPSLGDVLQLASCSAASTQSFSFATHHQIRYGGLCFNVLGGNPHAASRQLGLWDGCDWANPPYENEQFNLRGRIRSMGQCASLVGAWSGPATTVPQSSSFDGQAIVTTTCTAAPNPVRSNDSRMPIWNPEYPQDWDFYW